MLNTYTDGDLSLVLQNQLSGVKTNEVSKKHLIRLQNEIKSGRLNLESVVSCVCCGRDDFINVSNVDRFSLPFTSLLCQDCGLISTSPRLKEEDLPYYYSELYHPINFGRESMETHKHKHLFSAGQGLKIYKKISPYITKGSLKILEIGSGMGDVISGIIKADQKSDYALAVGMEYNRECLVMARRHAKENALDIQFAEGGFNEAKLISSKYNIIILSHVFEHLIDLKLAMEQLNEMLEDDGLLYVEVPGLFVNHMKEYYNYTFVDYTIHAHMYNFSAQSLVNVLVSGGFECLSINESVEGVFKKNKNIIGQPIKNNYQQVLFYLKLIGDKDFLKFSRSKDSKIKKINKELGVLSDKIIECKAIIDSLEEKNKINELLLMEKSKLLLEYKLKVNLIRQYSVVKHPFLKFQAYACLFNWLIIKQNVMKLY